VGKSWGEVLELGDSRGLEIRSWGTLSFYLLSLIGTCDCSLFAQDHSQNRTDVQEKEWHFEKQ
jgi:hypothetical protein